MRAIDTSVDDGAIIRCLKKDTTKNKEEALKEIYKKLRPGEPPDRANAEALIKRLFLDTKRYDLAKVGRHMLNLKLGLETPLDIRVTTVEDLVAATRKLTTSNEVRVMRKRREKMRVRFLIWESMTSTIWVTVE